MQNTKRKKDNVGSKISHQEIKDVLLEENVSGMERIRYRVRIIN